MRSRSYEDVSIVDYNKITPHKNVSKGSFTLLTFYNVRYILPLYNQSPPHIVYCTTIHTLFCENMLQMQLLHGNICIVQMFHIAKQHILWI